MLYVIRFENNKQVVAVQVESGPQDRINKEAQAEKWKQYGPNREWITANYGSPYIKLVNGKIENLTQKEIDALQPIPPRDLIKEIDDLTKRVEELENG